MGEIFEFDLQRSRLYTQVADRLQQLIVAEALKAGDKLPAERELAKRLGVSRTVVREAIRVLAVRGLLKVKQGCGTYVRNLDAQDAAAPLGLLLKMQKCPDFIGQLNEVRSTIEVEIAGLAAQRATSDDLAGLRHTLAEMKAAQNDPQSYAEHDLAFHLALAAATHNQFYGLLLQTIAKLLSEVIALSVHAPAATEVGLGQHEHLVQSIEAHDEEGAREAMRAQLRTSVELLQRAQREVDIQD